jgi:DNA-binding IclR family transcriptional regulator
MTYAKHVPAAERTIRLLEVLSTSSYGFTAAELIVRLHISRSSLFALLHTLKVRRYVEQEDNRYRLGPALWTLLPGCQHGLGSLIDAFHNDAELGMLAETVALAWLDGVETVIIAQRESPQPVRAVFRPGERCAALGTAAGLILLAGLPVNTLHVHLSRQVHDFMPTLSHIHTAGWADIQQGDTVELAAPVCVDGIQPVAALLATIPAFRASPEAVAALVHPLRQAAARLSYRMGAPVYQPYGWASSQPLGPTSPLSQADVERFLQGPWSARLACVRLDGTPHVIPLWYEWADCCMWITASPDASWRTCIMVGKQVSLTVDEPWPPLRRAFIAGHAEPVANANIPGGLVGLRRRLATRYLGQGAASRAEFQQIKDWQAFRITPHKITGLQGLGRDLGGSSC